MYKRQVQDRSEKTTKSGSPYLELTLADATGNFTLKVWSNHSQFKELEELPLAVSIRAEGSWSQNQYGIDGKNWRMRVLTEAEIADFFSGDPATARKQQEDWDFICACSPSPISFSRISETGSAEQPRHAATTTPGEEVSSSTWPR